MIWTIAWVTVVALALSSLALWGLRTNRTIGGVAIAAAAFGWAFARWAWIDDSWFLVRPLGGGWVWLTIILFTASLVMAFVLWRVAKLIGSISLFFAVLAPFGDLFSDRVWSWSTVIILIIIVALVAAIGLLLSASTAAKAAGVALLAMVVLLGGGGLGFSLLTGDNDDSTPAVATESMSPPTDSAPPSASPTEEAEIVDCPKGFTQKVIHDEELNRFIKGGINADTAIKSRDKLLSAVKHDASSLLFYARLLGVQDLPSEAQALSTDGTCLSEAGQQVHHDLTVVMNASSTSFGEAPADAYNSGVDNDGLPVIDTAPGISGPKKALKVKLPDGSMVIILVRCGNPVFATPPPDLPPGDTDNPDTPETPDCPQGWTGMPPNCVPPPPPEEECPPGTTGTPPNCVEPKDPSEDPAQNNNAPEGGGHNDNDGPGTPNPSPTFPDDPYTPPPPPPPPPPTTPSPTQPPEGGGGGGEDNPPGDPGAP